MSDANALHLGLRQGGSDNNELFMVNFSAEVITAYETAVKFKDKQMVRTITAGKSEQFPATFKPGTEYHVPGVELNGMSVPFQAITITIDDQIVSHVFIPEEDAAKNHYDASAPLSTSMGRELALYYDKNVARNIILASRGAELFTGDGGGGSLTLAAYATDGSKLLDGIGAARQKMDEKDVPVDTDPVFAALKAAQWYLVAATDRNINRDYQGVLDKSGNAMDTLRPVYDVEIIKSNALPFGVDESAAAGILAKYRGNWTNTIGVVWTPNAVGTLQLRDLSLRKDYDTRRLGDLIVGKQMVGHGPLRTKCAVELKIA